MAHFEAGRYRDAEPLGRQLLAIAERNFGDRPLQLAAACNNLANTYDELARYSEAIDLHRRALELRRRQVGESDPLYAESLDNLAVALLHNAEYEEAESLMKQALRIRRLRLGQVHRQVAATLNNLAILCLEQGRFREAEDYYKQSLEMKQRLFPAGHAEIALAINNLATLYRETGQLREAEVQFRRALALRKRSLPAGHPDLASSYENIGIVLLDQGRWNEAEPLLKQTLRIRQDKLGPEHVLVASTLNNIGNLYAGQQRLVESEKLYRRALAIYRQQLPDDHPHVRASLNNLAILYKKQQRYAEARRLYQQLLAQPGTAGNPDLQAVHWNNLASLDELEGDLDAAQSGYEQALAAWERASKRNEANIALALNNLANLAHHAGRNDEALKLVDRAVAMREYPAASNDDDLHDSLRLRGQILNDLGATARAIIDLERAVDLAERQRMRLSGSDADRATAYARFSPAFELLMQLHAKQGDLSAMLATSERFRSRLLVEALQSAGVDLLAGIPSQQAAELRRNLDRQRQRVSELQAALQRLSTDDTSTAEEIGQRRVALESHLHAAAQDLVQADTDLRAASRVIHDGAGTRSSLTELQAWADRNQCLVLDYMIGDESAHVLAVAPGRLPELHPLQVTPELATQVETTPGALTRARLDAVLRVGDKHVVQQLARADWAEQATGRLADLWQLLVPENCRQQLCDGAAERLLVIPDGALHLLPFDALVVTPGRHPQYLLDVGPPVCTAPSATVLLQLANRPAVQPPGVPTVLTAGDPDYNLDPASRQAAEGVAENRFFALGGQLPELPHSGTESRWVAEVFGRHGLRTVRLQGSHATEAAIRREVAGSRVVHLACHGFTDQLYGNLFGALAVSRPAPGVRSADDDGFLSLSEIYGLDMRACELAILGACRTNFGPQQQGEGVLSLSRGCLVAGCRRVVASNWHVDDEAAASLVSVFCGGICRAKQATELSDYAASLHRAKKWIRQQEKWQSPFYWATFTLVGPD